MTAPDCNLCGKPMLGPPAPFCCDARREVYEKNYAGEWRAVPLGAGQISVEYVQAPDGTWDWTLKMHDGVSVTGMAATKEEAVRAAADEAIARLAGKRA